MAQIGTCWDQASWDVGAWATDTWSGSVIPPTPVVTETSGGGRWLRPRREYRPLNKRERADLDRLFQRNAKPRYVAPSEPVHVTKRTAPVVITVVQDAPPITKPAERIQAARQFLALDALEAFLDQLERDAPLNAARVAHIRAKQHALWLAEEQERLALAALAQQEVDRLEVIRVAEALELKRVTDAEDMLAVLLLVHDGIVA